MGFPVTPALCGELVWPRVQTGTTIVAQDPSTPTGRSTHTLPSNVGLLIRRQDLFPRACAPARPGELAD